MSSGELSVREATIRDVAAISEIFLACYGRDYPYEGFFDEEWLTRTIYNDDSLMLVCEDRTTGRVAGTASVLFSVGDYSDLLGEFGRLAVLPEARGRGVGKLLMASRIEAIRDRLHVGLVENRTSHTFSQQISERNGFAPVGFLPLKHQFVERESQALYVKHFGQALELRKNHPRIIPEVYDIAQLGLGNCGLACDVVVDESSASYPDLEDEVVLEELRSEGVPPLIRIERGRVRQREVFGPVRLQYGFFKLQTRRATYLVARDAKRPDHVLGAIGFTYDPVERSLRIFQLIAPRDDAHRLLLRSLLRRADDDLGATYIEIDVRADAPRLQRTLVELGFVPVAYVPAMVFHRVERLDVVKMCRLPGVTDLGHPKLTPEARAAAGPAFRAFRRRAVQPQIAAALQRLSLFEGLDPDQTSRVAGTCSVRHLEAGEVLFRRGQPADAMSIVIDGEISVCCGESGHELGRVGSGEPIGEISTLTGEPHSATATAIGPVTTARIERPALVGLVRQRPDIGVAIYRTLATSLGRKLQRTDRAMALDQLEPTAGESL